MNGKKIAPLLCASVLWGTTGTAQTLAHLTATPPVVGAARLLAGGLALWLAGAVTGRLSLTELFARGRRGWFLAAGLGTAIYQAAFFAAVARTGVALGTLIALGSAPVFCGLLANALAGERLPTGWVLCTGCAVLGCSMLLAPDGRGGVDLLGVGLALVAGACYGVYTVCVKRLLATQADPLSVLIGTVTIGAVLLSPVFITGAGALWSPAGALLVVWLGPVATAGAYVLFVRGLAHVPARTAGTLSLAEPLTATALGTIVLAESWSPAKLAGGALLALGLALSARQPADNEQELVAEPLTEAV